MAPATGCARTTPDGPPPRPAARAAARARPRPHGEPHSAKLLYEWQTAPIPRSRGVSWQFPPPDYDPVYGRLRAVTAPTPGNPDRPRHADGYDRYSLPLAGWQVLSLNSEEPVDLDSRPLRWLLRQVCEPGDCRLAFWHRPRYSAGPHGDQGDLEPLCRALRLELSRGLARYRFVSATGGVLDSGTIRCAP